MDLIQAERKMRQIIDELPQRSHLGDADITLWVTEVLRMDPERGAWHAVRLSGFGGSEIGTLVRNYLGERADHLESARSLVERKLLLRLPDPPTPAMLRGIENEDSHAKRLYSMLRVQRDVPAYEALVHGRGPRPWMRYSPDDLVVDAAGRRTLWDYKAPTEVDQEARIAIQYAAQLHMGAVVAAHNGIQLDALALSQFDWKNWDLKNDDVPYSEDLARLLVAAGDAYWYEYVLKGQVPPYVPSKPLQAMDDWLKQNDVLIGHIAVLKSLGKEVSDLGKQLETQLTSQLADRLFNGGYLQDEQRRIKITANRSVDIDKARQLLGDEAWYAAMDALKPADGVLELDPKKMEAALRASGADLRPLKSRKPSADFIFALLRRHDIDPELAITEEIRLKVGDGPARESQEWVTRNFEDARQLLRNCDLASVAPLGTAAHPPEVAAPAPRHGEMRQAA